MDAAAVLRTVSASTATTQARSSRRCGEQAQAYAARYRRPHARLLHRPLSAPRDCLPGYPYLGTYDGDSPNVLDRLNTTKLSSHSRRNEYNLLQEHHSEQREKRRQVSLHPDLQLIHALAARSIDEIGGTFRRQSAPHSAPKIGNAFLSATLDIIGVADTGSFCHLAAHAVRGGRRQAVLALVPILFRQRARVGSDKKKNKIKKKYHKPFYMYKFRSMA